MKTARKIKDPRIKDAVVLAAGLGERLRPLTFEFPKPAIPFLNKPVICHIFDDLLAYGVTRVFVNLHHLPEKIRESLEPYQRSVEIIYSYEKEILGTAGVFSMLNNRLPAHFFVVNGDIHLTLPLHDLETSLLQGGKEAVFLLKRKDAGQLYTSLKLEDGGKISAVGTGGHFFCGVYAASRSFVSPIVNVEKKELVAALMIPKIDEGLTGGLEFEGGWYDLGSPETFLGAAGHLLKKIAAGELPIPENCRLIKGSNFLALRSNEASVDPDAEISGFATFSEGCRVETNVRLENVVILPHTVIRSSSDIRNAIVYKDKLLKIP